MRSCAILALGLLIVVLSATLGVDGWGYVSPDVPLPDQWPVLYPTCRDSAVYPQSPSPLSVPASQIETTWGEIETNATFSAPIASIRRSTAGSTFTTVAQITLNLPGLLVGTVLDAGVLFQFRTTWYRFHKFLLHSGVEHGSLQPLNVTDGGEWKTSTPVAELQFHFAPADSVGTRQALVVALPLYSTTDANPPSSSFLEELLIKLNDVSSMDSNGARTTTGMVELFPSNGTFTANGASDDPWSWVLPSGSTKGAFFYYSGSTTTPPCESAAWLVSRHRTGITVAGLNRLLSITGAATPVNATRPMQSQKLFVKALLTQIVPSDSPSGTSSNFSAGPTPHPANRSVADSSNPNPANERMRKVLIVLISVVIIQILLLLILVAARREWISLPTNVGGLAKPLEFWSNPTSHHTWEDVESENEEEDDSSNAEGSGEEGEEDSGEESPGSSEWSFNEGGSG